MRRLLQTKQDETLYTAEAFRKKIEQSSAQAAEGRYIEMRQDETVDQFIDRMP